MPDSQKRQVAIKARIKDLISGRYVKLEGWEPNYILTDDNRKISRVNLAGVVISKPEFTGAEQSYNYLILDDGSERIAIRSFDENPAFKTVDIGDPLLVVGRPREFGNEKYVLPEIVKKIQNPKWIQVRQLELQLVDAHTKDNVKASEDIVTNAPETKEEYKSESIPDEHGDDSEEPLSSNQKLLKLIKELDAGEGADFEEIIAKSETSDAENVINMLLEDGEIFEIKPGKLKVLE